MDPMVQWHPNTWEPKKIVTGVEIVNPSDYDYWKYKGDPNWQPNLQSINSQALIDGTWYPVVGDNVEIETAMFTLLVAAMMSGRPVDINFFNPNFTYWSLLYGWGLRIVGVRAS